MITKNCKALFGKGDGFSYQGTSKGIEIGNVGSYNGDGSTNTHNGTTAHGGTKVLRIDGEYNNNHGPNVADVQTNTESININCVAYDTEADIVGQTSSDFSCSQGDCTMYLLNCYTKNSSTRWQLYNSDTTENNVMMIFNTLYDLSKAHGELTEYVPSLFGNYVL